MKMGPTKAMSKNFIKKLGTLNQDYVVHEQIGVDGKIHRNFVTLEQPERRNMRFTSRGRCP
jgi:hypothetical protein